MKAPEFSALDNEFMALCRKEHEEYGVPFTYTEYDVDKIKDFLQKNNGHNFQDIYLDGTNNLLHIAATKGDVDLVKSLLDNGFDVNETNAQGKTALELTRENDSFLPRSLSSGTQAMQDILIEKKKELDAPDEEDQQLFLDAVRANNQAEVREYIKDFPSIANKAKDRDGNTALHLAVEHESLDLVKILIEEGHSDIYAKNNKKEMPVDLARDRIVWDRAVENHRADIRDYLKQVNDNLNSLHQNFRNLTSQPLTSAMPWLAKLKNEEGVSYEDRENKRKIALGKVSDAKRRADLKKEHEEDKARKKVTEILQEEKLRLKRKGVAMDAAHAALNKIPTTVEIQEVQRLNAEQEAKNQRVTHALEKEKADHKATQLKLAAEKAVRQQAERAAVPGTIRGELKSKTLGDILGVDASRKGGARKSKLELLVAGLAEESSGADSKELASMLAKERMSAKIAKKIFGRKTDHERALAAIDNVKTKDSIKEGAEALKELASFFVKERRSAKAAKWLTGGGRKTDHDLAMKVIKNVKTAIENSAKDAGSADRKELTQVSRWKKKDSSKAIS